MQNFSTSIIIKRITAYDCAGAKCLIFLVRAVGRTLIGGCIFIYSGSARLVSFEIKLMSKEYTPIY